MVAEEITSRLGAAVHAATVLGRSGLLGPLRPDKYVRMAGAIVANGVTPTTGVVLAARRCPRRAALIDDRGVLSWAELDARSDALAVGLRSATPEPPVRVALLARNHRGFVETLVAAGKLGADALLLNTGFAGPQLAEVIEREQPDVVVADEEFDELLEHAPGLPRVVAWQDVATDRVCVEGLIAEHLGEVPGAPVGTPHVVLLTSGTTGTPKGARRGAGGGGGDLVSVLERVPWRTEETVVVAAPMFHGWGFGCLVLAATMADTIVTRRRFDAEATLADLSRHHATGLAVVPVMIDRISSLPEEVQEAYPTPDLRFVTASGSATDPTVLERFTAQRGHVVHTHYNATEAGMIATATPADLRESPRTAGHPVAGCEVRIAGEDGEFLPDGAIGEIVVRNGTLFEGYTGGDGRLLPSGWMPTGDVGWFDGAGRLTVEGRSDDMIVSGGENVYPGEVEQALARHPDVQDAAVIGVQDAEYGQRLAAFVVIRPGGSVGPEDLRGHVRSELATYKVPRSVTLLEELPRNAAGKVMKRELPADGGGVRKDPSASS